MITRNQTKTKAVLSLAVMLGVFAAFSGSLQADLLVYEPFNYTANVAVDGLSVTGTGLTGTWTANYSGTEAKIKGGSMTYSTLATTANHWGPGGVWLSPAIEATLDPAVMAAHLDDGDELWFSFVGHVPLSTGTVQNAHILQIGADDANNMGIYADKIDDPTGRVRAVITIGGVETVSTGSATFTENTRFFVGRVIFGPTDKVEVYLPGPDLALPASPAGIVTGSLDQSTFDMLRSVVYNGNSGVDADEIRIGTTYSDVIGSVDPTLPEVYAGVNMITWSGQAVQLDPNVVNNDPCEPQAPLTYAWSADPNDGVVFSATDVEEPNVTITTPALLTTEVAIVNPGFEVPVKADGDFTDGLADCPGWSYVDEQTQGGVWNPGLTGYEGWEGNAPEGENIAYVTKSGIEQVLTETLTAETTYTLTVEVGNLKDSPWTGYKVQLLAGETLLAEDDNTVTIAEDTFETSTVIYTSGADDVADPNVGQPLQIQLHCLDANEVDFDDVKLTGEGPTPDPYVVALTLAVNNKDSGKDDVKDAMTIDVYDDACEAAISRNAIDPGDFDWNCITDANDLDALATKWLDDYSLTEPVAKP